MFLLYAMNRTGDAGMDKVNWGLVWPLLALQILLAIVGLISLARAEKVRGRNGCGLL